MDAGKARSPPGAGQAWQAQASRYALLFDTVLLIARSRSLEELLRQAINKIKWVIDFDRCGLALRAPGADTYRYETLIETRRDVAPATIEAVSVSEGLPGEVMMRGQMRVIDDVAQSPSRLPPLLDPALADGSTRSLMALPLSAFGRGLGAIVFGAAKPGRFVEEDIKIATQFATHLGLAIDRWQQMDALEREIAERERTQDALRASEKRYALVSAAAAEGIYDWNVESGDLYVSTHLNEMFGFADGELRAEDWNERVHQDDYQTYVTALRNHFRGTTARLECEYRVRNKEDRYLWVRDQGIAVRNDEGRVVRLVGAISNITEQREARNALAESEERYAIAMSAVGEAVYDWNVADGRVYYSPGIYEHTGFSGEELASPEDWNARIHPADRERYRNAVIDHFKRRTDRFECEYRYRAPGGEWRWVRQHGRAMWDENGRAYRMIGATGDITERMELALALERAQRQLAEAIEAISEGFALFDAEDRLVMCNSVYRNYFSSVSEMVTPGNRFEDFMRAGHAHGMFPNAGEVDPWLGSVLVTRQNPSGTREQYLDSGTWLQISDRRTADGGLVSVYTDVTEIKRHEHELQGLVDRLQAAITDAEQARNRLSEAIEAVSEGFVLYGPDDRLVLFNSRFREFFFEAIDILRPGVAFESIVRSVAGSGLIPLGEEGLEGWVGRRLRSHRNPGPPQELRLANGRWVKISERRTADGGIVGVYTDITELKERETQLGELVDRLAQARDQAMQATRAKSQFLANMSHELRTPLNAVIGLAEMLQEDARDLGQDDFLNPLERINRAGKHLLNLINEILDLSKIEAGKIDLVPEDFHVAKMVRELATMAQPLAGKNGNTLTVECSDDVGTMHADPTRVRQVVFNLLSNACKFTENGEVRVTVRRVPGVGGERITFAVSDSGIGISEEQISRLFQDFSQADASTTRKYGGTGLGLAISQRLCRMMGGEIEVESALGEGATFTATLPAIVREVHSRPDDERSRGAPAGTAAGKAARESNRVLVIDDDETVRELMLRHLAATGAEVTTARDGNEGLALARELMPAVITLDVLMPGKDGWEVLRELKADPELADIPVVMVTILHEENKGYALGASEFLTKPVERERLHEVVGSLGGGAAGVRVLIVEDDEATRTMLRRLLVGQGCLVSEAGNGRVGLERVSEHVPDLILLDLMMPEMDGFEFLAELRRDKAHATIPVVVITAADLSEDDHARLNGGVRTLLQKRSFERDALLAEVRREVGRVLRLDSPSGRETDDG